MTEQQIKQLIADIEERLWLKTIKRCLKQSVRSLVLGIVYPINKISEIAEVFGDIVAGSAPMICLFVLGASIWSYPAKSLGIISILFLIVGSVHLWREMVRPESARIWSIFIDHYRNRNNREALSKESKELVSRIFSLYELDKEHKFSDGFRAAIGGITVPDKGVDKEHKFSDGFRLDDGPNILRVEQAAQLLNIFESEHRRLMEINTKLEQNSSRYQLIEPHYTALKECHKEINREGEHELKMLAVERENLLATKSQLEQSVNNLELILKAAEDERDARAHHRFIHDKVSQYPKTALPEPGEMIRGGDVLRELEDGIAAEIKAYVEIEAKLRRITDSVQTVD